MSETALLTTLYIVSFTLELLGVLLIVREIRDDIRAAQRLREPDEREPAYIEHEQPGVRIQIGGVAGAAMARTAHRVDSFREFTAQRLTEGLWWRAFGVGLIVLGAAIGLAANVIAVA